jgi:23S rRNA (adenine2030-N6)-methyltransferase
MLSYQHGFHAGNHADVLKHVVLCAILARLTLKPSPLRYIETHAGAGGYDLGTPIARKNREHETGVAKLWSATEAPAAVERWLALVRRYNAGPTLRRYPGSPWLARASLRPDDRLFLYELHPAEHRALKSACAEDRRVKVLREDGLVGCVGLVPPPAKRALLFIDPSYERKDEYREVVDAVRKAHERFATGVVAVWYPVLERRAPERFERALRALGLPAVSLYELDVARPRAGGGLAGSAMLVVNTPWQLDEELEHALPWLATHLGQADGAQFRIER